MPIKLTEPKRGVIQNLIIVSAGKFGRETYSWAEQAIAAGARLKIKGFLDDRPRALDGFHYPVGVLGSVDNYKIQENDVFVGAIGTPQDKVKYCSPIIERGGRFTNVIHPLAIIGRNARLGAGIVMGPFSCFSCDVKIGNHISIGSFSNVGHDAVVGDWSQICGHCGINGNVTIEEGVFLGSHACIIPGIHLGAWSFMGAGSVVIRDVPPGARVFGNPADPIAIAKRPA
jgi:sugar O-acyltransferase (sialic acid O-acetyltransferase NeuD family)